MPKKLSTHALSALTDEEVTALYHLYAPGDNDERKEWFGRILRKRTVDALYRKLPRSIGTCSKHGLRVMLDDQGPMATGYPYHVDENGRGIWGDGGCDDFKGIVWDPPTPEARATRALIDTLRDGL